MKCQISSYYVVGTEAQKMIDPQLVVTVPGVLHLSIGLSHSALFKDAER